MRRYDKAGWLLAGAALALLLIPSGALSAVTTSFVTLTDKGGTHFAKIDKAQQVLASEADTTQVLAIYGFAEPVNCFSLYTVPAGKALVVKTGQLVPVHGQRDVPGGRCHHRQRQLQRVPGHAGRVHRGRWSIPDADARPRPGRHRPIGVGAVHRVLLPDDGASTSFVMRGYLIPAGAAPPARQLAIESPAVRKALASQHARQTP